MKTIKFRAWDEIHKQMFNVGENYSIKFNEEGIFVITDIDVPKVEFVSSNTKLMQFTGLLDKNKKEIFEGDIVKLYCGSNKEQAVTATIIWEDVGFWAGIHNKRIKVIGGTHDGEMKYMREIHSWCGMHSCFSFPRYIEVIGNIYENLELLEDKK